MAPRTFLIDGTALAYRSFYQKGGPGRRYAYASSLLSLIEREKPDYVLIAMDTKGPTKRHEKYPTYKATRPPMDPDLVKLLPVFEGIATDLGIPVHGLKEWEADDIIGTIAVQAEKDGHEVVIVSGDKDFMQLVSDQVSILNPTQSGNSKIQGAEAVREKFFCRPDQVIDVLALMGDSSDNVPGVPKIGPKHARTLIENFENLDDIYHRIEEVSPPGLAVHLRNGEELARLSLDLVTIRTDLNLDFDLESLRYQGPDSEACRAKFVKWDFPSLAKRVGGEAPPEEGRKYHVVSDTNAYAAFLQEVKSTKEIVLDLETTSLRSLEAEIVGLSFSFAEKEAWYLPANLKDPIFGPGDRGRTAAERAGGLDQPDGMFSDPEGLTTGSGVFNDPLTPPEGSDLARFIADLKPILEDPTVSVIGQNIKYDLHVLSRYGIRPAAVGFDTLLASFVLNAHQNQHNLDFLSLKHLEVTKIPTSELIGKGSKQISMWDVEVERCGEYACEDADCTYRLFQLFRQALEDSPMRTVFTDIEMPILRIIEEMEENGILLDTDHLAALSIEMGERLEKLTKDIHKEAGEDFNIASPKQLGQVLYEKLKIHEQLGVKIKKTQPGFSTAASELEQLSEHPLPAAIIEYRRLSKLTSTYVDALPGEVNPVTGRIHTSYHQGGASTGRLSSSNPNLQNIPSRTKEGRRIREAFVAPKGFRLVSADYSQVELRLLAHLSKDEALMAAFREGADIHHRTASLVFDLSDEKVTGELRSRAKAINFGIIYGMGAQRLAGETGLTPKEAAKFIEQYFEAFPKIKAWIQKAKAEAESTGFAETLTGRRRRIEGMNSSDGRERAAAHNQAVNTPIQGAAADLIKIAMVKVHEALKETHPTTLMLLQVHDELIFEVPKKDVASVSDLVVEAMSSAMALDVPLVVDVGSGKNWLEAH